MMKTIKLLFLLFAFSLAQTYTLVDSTHKAFSDDTGLLLGYSGRNYVANPFTPSSSFQIGKVEIYCQKNSGDNNDHDYYMSVWGKSNGQPTTKLSSDSDVLDGTTFPAFGSPDWITFTFSTPYSVTAGDSLYLVIYSATGNSDNGTWRTSNDIAEGDSKPYYDADGTGTWTLYYDGGNTLSRVYALPEEDTDKGFKKYGRFGTFPK